MPSSSSSGSAATAAAMARRSSGAAPTRCMPVSTLTWTATGRPGRGRCRAEGGDPLGGVQRRREPVGQRRGRGGGIALAQQEHRCGDAVLAQLHPLVDQCDGEPSRAAGQRGPGHRRPPVAVAVGLDHRAELGRSGQAGQHRRVVRDRGQVDLGPGRARAPLGHGHRRVRRPPEPAPPAAPRHLTRRRPPDHSDEQLRHQARQVAGHQALRRTERCGAPVHVGGDGRRRQRGEPAGTEGADDRPRARRRCPPWPATGRRPPASRTSGVASSGAATAVSGPLSRTTAPVARASARAAARRSRPGAAPAMRAYSPSCGRQDARRAALAEQRAGRRGVAQRGQRVGVDHQRHGRRRR